jgi:serine/threonine protein kinase
MSKSQATGIKSRPNESAGARLRRQILDRERKRQRRATPAPDSVTVQNAAEFTDNELLQSFYSHVGDIEASGGFGSVRACTITSIKGNKSKVALKTVKWIDNPDVDRFGSTFHEVRLEAEILKDLNKQGKHPHLPTLLWQHVSREQKTFSMVMLPFFEDADSLRHDGNSSSFTSEDLKTYIHALLSALDFVHRTAIVHLDVKPQNFVYSRSRRQYLLVDFGLACKVGRAAVWYYYRLSVLKTNASCF